MLHLKQALNNREVREDLDKWCQERVLEVYKKLELTSDTTEIFRLQGQIISYKRLSKLREELKND